MMAVQRICYHWHHWLSYSVTIEIVELEERETTHMEFDIKGSPMQFYDETSAMIVESEWGQERTNINHSISMHEKETHARTCT